MRYVSEESIGVDDRRHKNQEEAKHPVDEKPSSGPKGYNHEHNKSPSGYQEEAKYPVDEKPSSGPKGYHKEQNSGLKKEDSPGSVGYQHEEGLPIESNPFGGHHQDYQVHSEVKDHAFDNVFYINEEQAAKLKNGGGWKELEEFNDNESIEDKNRGKNDKFDYDSEEHVSSDEDKRNKGKSSVSKFTLL